MLGSNAICAYFAFYHCDKVDMWDSIFEDEPRREQIAV